MSRVSKACGIVALAAVLAGPLGIARAEARTAAPAPHPAGKAVHTAKHAHGRPATRHAMRSAPRRHPAAMHILAGRRPARTPNDTAAALAPTPAQPLIVIDPGHGGEDPGAIGVSGTLEKTITLAAAEELRRAIAKTGRYRVALTRTRDRTVSLAARLSFAEKHDADLLIAVHADASPDHRARGASVYVSNRNITRQFAADRGNSHRIATALAAPEPQPAPGSAWLQYSMIEQLADDVQMSGAPARHAQLYVLGSRNIPSVLLEMGFLSNRQDEAMLKQPARRQVLVQAITDAIDDYFAGIGHSPSRT
jgi:N-acetylmuramoyl-L-alanine amidase